MIRPFDSLMLRTTLAPLVAAVQLVAVYLLLHGHYSPGGGFVAGVLFAASFILPRLTFGQPQGWLALTPQRAALMAVAGIIIFAGIGVAPMFVGETMLDYAVLPLAEKAEYRRSLGILLIEVGVTMAVAGAMLSIFYALSGPVGGEK
ncbi:MAG TPA: MnhB domain-containing protein [Longimicrobiales bacterium]|nr:MnhB domain-containing protein [Longimicrobiales bacterium]